MVILREYKSERQEETLWNIAVHFGIYLGETLLRLPLEEKGYEWYMDDGIPILKNGENGTVSPVTKVHKRILYGDEDIVRKYYENVDTDEFLKNIPCIDATEETKRYMGLI